MLWPGSQDIVLGTTAPPFPYPQFRLSPADQDHHATIWGRTGSGKSRLLESIFLQHLNKGHGVGLIEPHHDLSYSTLTYLISKGFFHDELAFDRLVYVDWAAGYVPFNVLAGDGDPHDIALLALEAMMRVWPELTEAPLFQTLFLSSLLALIQNHLPITYLHEFLASKDFRAACLENVDDPLVQQQMELFEKLGRDQVGAAGSTLRRAFLLSYSPAARLTLGQSENWLNFRAWMDAGISVIINLGNINDNETRKLIGAMILVQIEQVALSRKNLPPTSRRPWTLLIDEWPSFAAQERTIGTVLSQCRKFGLRLYLAAQSISQVGSERLSGALENCRLSIVFGLGRDSAALQARHIGKVDPFLLKEEALTPTQHGQYMPVIEQFEAWTQEVQNLSPRMAYVKLHDAEAVKIKTLSVPDTGVPAAEVERVLTTYRQRYQRTKEEAEAAISKLALPHEAQAAPPAYTTLFQRGKNSDQPETLPN
ncbi:MAG TPA: hypothetical protein DEV93_03890 [Chloroflexi bacterium]|jgi:hypothetical protein|nr:hypothetical protein [Chloroflexota bacterium]